MPTDIPAYTLPQQNRQVLLQRRPNGVPQAGDFELATSAMPKLSEGTALVRNVYLSVDPAQRGWASAEALCDHILKNEQEVTASINNLYAIAEKTKDRPATVMLQWFVTEQMEEEAAARAVLGRIRLAGNSGVGLLMIDQELATGRVPGMPVEGGGTDA